MAEHAIIQCLSGASMHCFVLLLIDLLIISASTTCAIALSTGLHLPIAAAPQDLLYGLLTLGVAVPMCLAARLNRTLWRFTSLQDCLRILIALTATLLAATMIAKAFSIMGSIPISGTIYLTEHNSDV